MKRFAVLLIIAVLTIGCVFAASTGDDSTGDVAGKNATSGDFFYLETSIGRIYPVYQIIGYTGDDESATGSVTSAKAASASKITVTPVTDDKGVETVSVKVAIQHYGLANNDAASTTKANIRYKGTVKVTVTGGKLINQRTGAAEGATEYVYSSELPVATAFTAKTGITNFNATANAASANTASVKAEYTNGKAVQSGSAQTIANACTLTWTTTDLTAGDTYKAEIVVTYENV